jgi:hypothetical protein
MDAHIYNSKHTHHLLACISLQPHVHFIERVRSVESHPRLPVKVVRQARGALEPLPSQNISGWVGTCGLAQRNAAAPAFFFRPLLCRALILIRSFLVLPAPTSRFRVLVLAQMTDGPGPPRLTSSCAFAPPCRPLAISSVPVMPSSLFFDAVNIVPTSLPHPAILCSPLFSCRTSCLRVRCLLRKTPFRLFPCLSTFLSSFFTSSP